MYIKYSETAKKALPCIRKIRNRLHMLRQEYTAAKEKIKRKGEINNGL